MHAYCFVIRAPEWTLRGILSDCNVSPSLRLSVAIHKTVLLLHDPYIWSWFSEQPILSIINQMSFILPSCEFLPQLSDNEYCMCLSCCRWQTGKISLDSTMKFATGANEEPQLGFAIQPSIYFIKAVSFLPTANSCICHLNLTVPGDHLALSENNNVSKCLTMPSLTYTMVWGDSSLQGYILTDYVVTR